MEARVLVIVGPTASGKSAFAVRLAKKIGGEVISADSRQVYRGLDIGSGKITRREMKGVPHHLLDVASPKKVFTAHQFAVRGREVLGCILARGKVPIICGGTGFYIDALLGRVTLPDVSPNPKLRARLAKKTPRALFEELQKLDPARAKTIDRHNPVRLIRAIEIAKVRGRVPRPRVTPLPYSVRWIGLKPDDQTLKKKIRARLLARMKHGMLAEAKHLHAHGVSWKRMEALGLEYRYLALFLQKKITHGEMLLRLETEIGQYAKRQMTYWKRNTGIRWFSNDTNAQQWHRRKKST